MRGPAGGPRHKEALPQPSGAAGTSADGGEISEAAFLELKRQAILRGLDYLQRSGEAMYRNRQLASKHSADLLLPFYVPPPTAAGTPEERHAWRVATRLAGVYSAQVVKAAAQMPPRVPPSELLDLMQGLYSLECLGMAEPAVHAAVHERTAAWGATDFFKYDPSTSEPAKDLRETCLCGARPAAGAAECAQCRRPTIPMSKFDVWLEALVWSFHGCRMRIGLGACFFDVLKQVCHAFGKLYPRRAKLSEKDRHYLTYALTHVIYALNNFDERSLPPSLFPPSVPEFMREQLKKAIKADDPDLAGELLDCLKCLGEGGSPAARAAERFLISAQSSADGGWICKGEQDLFSRYHASLVAVAALMDHSYGAHGPVFPRAADVLPGWFGDAAGGAVPSGGGHGGALLAGQRMRCACPDAGCVCPSGVDFGVADSSNRCRECAVDGEAGTAVDIGDGAARSSVPLVLCDVDHTHENERRAVADALEASASLVPQYPLPPQQRQVVSLLPVMHRIHVREAVLADKRSQRSIELQLEARANAHRQFVERNGAALSAGGMMAASNNAAASELAAPHRAASHSRALAAELAAPHRAGSAPRSGGVALRESSRLPGTLPATQPMTAPERLPALASRSVVGLAAATKVAKTTTRARLQPVQTPNAQPRWRSMSSSLPAGRARPLL